MSVTDTNKSAAELIAELYTKEVRENIREHALAYSAKGFLIHRVRPLHRAAFDTSWQKMYNGPDEVNILFHPDKSFNVGIKLGYQGQSPEHPYLISIDLDTKNETTDTLIRHYSQMFHPSAVPPMRFGSKGMAWVIRIDPATTPLKNHFKLEFQREGGQLALPPSIHPDTKQPYRWIRFDGSTNRHTLENYTPDTIPFLSANRFKELIWVYDGENDFLQLNHLPYSGKGSGGEFRNVMLSLSAKMVNRGWSNEEIEERFQIALAWSKKKWDTEALDDWGDDDTVFFEDLNKAVDSARTDTANYQSNTKKMPIRAFADRWIKARGGDDRLRVDDLGQIRRYTKGIWEVVPRKFVLNEIMRVDFEQIDANTADRIVNTIEYSLTPVPKPNKTRIAMLNTILEMDEQGIRAVDFSPDHGLTWRIPINYDPEATCPVYEAFCARTFHQDHPINDEDNRNEEMMAHDSLAMRESFERFISYTLMNTAKFHKMLVLVGRPRTGKSTLLRLLEWFHEPSSVSHVSLTKMGDDRYHFDIVSGAVNISSETRSGSNETNADDFIKAVSAGDPVMVRRLYRDPVRVNPVSKLVFAGNIMFRTNDTSGAVEERILYLACDNHVPEEERDPDLLEKLERELPGILNHVILAGYRLLKENRFPRLYVMSSVREEMSNSDSVKAWLKMCTEKSNDEPEDNSVLYTHYRGWATDNGYRPCSINVWGTRCSDAGVKPLRSYHTMGGNRIEVRQKNIKLRSNIKPL